MFMGEAEGLRRESKDDHQGTEYEGADDAASKLMLTSEMWKLYIVASQVSFQCEDDLEWGMFTEGSCLFLSSPRA